VNIIERYLARTVLMGSLLAFLVLVALSAFFVFIDQLGDLRGDYTILKALEYMLYVIPSKGYELFHTSILLGSLLSLGGLASHSELIVLRAAGLSITRITMVVIKAGIILMLFGVLLGEVIAPPAEQHAQKLRTSAITGSTSIQSGQGIWSKNKQEFVQVGKVFPHEVLTDIIVYTFNEYHELSSILKATRAEYRDGRWLLYEVTETLMNKQSFVQKNYPQLERGKLIQPEMLDTLSVQEQDLSIISLYRYMQHLKSNQLDASKYELAFWMKLVKPFSALIMLLIAMPFVFGTLRSGNVGQRLLVGVLLGLGFHMFNQALNYIGVGYGLNPIVSAILPSILFVFAGIWALKRIF